MDQHIDSGEILGPILQALAESLDVREIFARISVEARRIVPHEFLLLGLLSEDRQHVRVSALSGELSAVPTNISIPVPLRMAVEEGAFIVSDVKADSGGKQISGVLQIAGHAEAQDASTIRISRCSSG